MRRATISPAFQTPWLPISIHALLAESDRKKLAPGDPEYEFLSTLSLRRATCRWHSLRHNARDFYPRSPCGERRAYRGARQSRPQFLSTLSLRRATICPKNRKKWHNNFYPRSPCGERRSTRTTLSACLQFLSTLSLRRATNILHHLGNTFKISIHALLAESDGIGAAAGALTGISIHALLAESDSTQKPTVPPMLYFYPRSPCGERPFRQSVGTSVSNFYPRSPCGERRLGLNGVLYHLQFLSTLSLRRATKATDDDFRELKISIHALLAESDRKKLAPGDPEYEFLSTLSLRRATERRHREHHHPGISIHALLAESDSTQSKIDGSPGYFYPRSPCGERLQRFLLWLRLCINFYPRSPCGERPDGKLTEYSTTEISIHALLAESDSGSLVWILSMIEFLSTLSLRRATLRPTALTRTLWISIHALLAESDGT